MVLILSISCSSFPQLSSHRRKTSPHNESLSHHYCDGIKKADSHSLPALHLIFVRSDYETEQFHQGWVPSFLRPGWSSLYQLFLGFITSANSWQEHMWNLAAMNQYPNSNASGLSLGRPAHLGCLYQGRAHRNRRSIFIHTSNWGAGYHRQSAMRSGGGKKEAKSLSILVPWKLASQQGWRAHRGGGWLFGRCLSRYFFAGCGCFCRGGLWGKFSR